jgi:hypothetical protein
LRAWIIWFALPLVLLLCGLVTWGLGLESGPAKAVTQVAVLALPWLVFGSIGLNIYLLQQAWREPKPLLRQLSILHLVSNAALFVCAVKFVDSPLLGKTLGGVLFFLGLSSFVKMLMGLAGLISSCFVQEKPTPTRPPAEKYGGVPWDVAVSNAEAKGGWTPGPSRDDHFSSY